jgi:flagellar biosynthesis component FlhA
MPDGTALVLIDEVPESLLTIDPQQVVVKATPERLADLGVVAQEFFDLGWGRSACVPMAERASVQVLGLDTMDACECLFQSLFWVVCRMPDEFLDLDQVYRRVSALPSELVQRTVPAVVSWMGLTQVLRALLEEGVGIGDLQAIVEALSQSNPPCDAIDEWVEMARCALSTQIAAAIRGEAPALRVLVAGAGVEALLLGGLQRSSAGRVFTLDPESLQQLLAAIRQQMELLGDNAEGLALLVADSTIRPFLRRLVMLEFPKLHVLSRRELPENVPVETVGAFGVNPQLP